MYMSFKRDIHLYEIYTMIGQNSDGTSRIGAAIEPLNQHFSRSSYPCELVPRSSV